MKDRSVKPNSDITLSCFTNDEENTRLSWRFNGVSLQSDLRHQMNESALTIIEVGKKDSGVYECIATNSNTGRVLKASAELIVIGNVN
jgi:hypothetical protein